MTRIVCPACGAQSMGADAAQPTSCTQCGGALPSPGQSHAGSWQTDDDALVAELRHAFAVGAGEAHGEKPLTVRPLRPGGSGAGRRWSRSALPTGTRLADFEIIQELGHGGMGVVYRARQLSLRREVALKVLPDYARHGRTAVRRFQNEAQAAAGLNHANIVPVYAQGEYEGNFYYAMKLVEGSSLDTVIKTHPELLSSTHRSRSSSAPTSAVSWRGDSSLAPGHHGNSLAGEPPQSIRRTRDDYCYLASLMGGVAEGLAHAHANGVIHRDIKPHNLLFGPDFQLYITDFGLAHLTSEPHLTITGEVLGTPSYMSPEQARGNIEEITHRTDIYSVGATLYELITGHQPFEGKSRHQIIHSVCHDEPPRPRRLDRRIPVDLETICLRAIEKDPRHRYESAAALAEDLRRFAEDRPILSRRVGVIERAAKWTRRHKTVTAAAVVTAALLAVSTGWAMSAAARQRREGDRLVERAYDQLVHRDYDKIGLVTEDIAQAEALGATNPRLFLVQALVDTKTSDHGAAIERLEQLLDDNPDNIEALYFLAWVRFRNDEEEPFWATLQQAEDLGGPRTAEAWFFRGLALHKTDAIEAEESYRTAYRMRAANDQFFPQAELHLARALNQRIYQTRSLDPFEEAKLDFRGLIKYEHYRGYADYLLSVAYRLAAEIYQDSPGEESHHLAQHHFDQALYWAREGRRMDPDSNRPITAEAMCLERLGRFEEALAARDQAIAHARLDEHRCEGHHYRWRLNYWLANLDDALVDIEEHTPCLPANPTSRRAKHLCLSYTHFFPALVHAEGGNIDLALDLVRAASEPADFGADAVLPSAAYLRIFGEPDEAMAILLDHMDGAESIPREESTWADEWQDALYAFALDEVPLESLEELASRPDFMEELAHQRLNPRRILGEAHFHAGAKSLAVGDRDGALRAFQKAHRSWDGATHYSFHGRIMLEQLTGKADWPAWIPVTQDGAAEPSDIDSL